VTGMDLPSSSKNWDMPNFFPRMPMDMDGGENASGIKPGTRRPRTDHDPGGGEKADF
jgi:hypothetical protein